MKRITVGLHALNYQDSRGVYISEGDTVFDGKKIYRVVQSDDKKFLGIEKDSNGIVHGFSEDTLSGLRKVSLSNNEQKAWEKLSYSPVNRDSLAV